MDQIKQEGARRVCARFEENEDKRLRTQQDIMDWYEGKPTNKIIIVTGSVVERI